MLYNYKVIYYMYWRYTHTQTHTVLQSFVLVVTKKLMFRSPGLQMLLLNH